MSSTATPSAPSHDDAHDHLDDRVDSPLHIRVNSAELEDEVLLKQLLGIDLHREDDPHTLAAQVGQRIFKGISGTRSGLTQAKFAELFEARLQTAFDRIDDRHHGHVSHGPDAESEHLQKVKAVADSLRQILPPEAFNDVFIQNDSVPYASAENLSEGTFEVPVVVPSVSPPNTNIRIDLNHVFWKTEYAKVDDLEKALDGKKLSEVGITIPGQPSTKTLKAADASAIAGSKDINVIPLNKHGTFEDNLTKNVAEKINFTFNINKKILNEKYDAPGGKKALGAFTMPELVVLLENNTQLWKLMAQTGKTIVKPTDRNGGVKASEQVAEKMFQSMYGFSAPAGSPLQPRTYRGSDIFGAHVLDRDNCEVSVKFDGSQLVKGTMNDGGTEKAIATLNQADLARLLLVQGNWDKYISVIGGNVKPTDNTSSGAPFNQAVALEIFKFVQGTTSPKDPLIDEKKELFKLQDEYRKGRKESFNFLEGSQNVAGAAIAASLLAKNPSLKSVLPAMDKTKIAADLEKAKANLEVFEMVEKLNGLTLPSASPKFDELLNVQNEIRVQSAKADFGENTITISGIDYEPLDASTSTPAQQKADMKRRMDALLKETIAKLEPFRQLEKQATLIRNFMSAKSFTASTQLDNFVAAFSTAPRDPKMNITELADSILKAASIEGKSKEDLNKAIKDLKEKKDAKEISGDQAQFLILKEYFKKMKGLNDKDAELAANHVLGTNQLSRDLAHAAEEVAEEIYGPRVDFETKAWNTVLNLKNFSLDPERRSQTIVRHVAEAFSIPTKRSSQNAFERMTGRDLSDLGRRERVEVQWDQASYPNLITAYYAMKQLYEGKGPAGIQIQQTEYVQTQMKEISKILLRRHSIRMLNDLGPAVHGKEWKAPATYDEQIAALKAIMEGEPPAHLKKRIEDGLKRADFRTDFWRKSVALGPNYGLLTGKKNKISARNLLYGNKWASIAGLYYRAPKTVLTYGGTKALAAGKATVERSPRAAAYAFLGMCAFGPAGLAAGAAIGLLKKSGGGGGGGGHDAHGGGHGH